MIYDRYGRIKSVVVATLTDVGEIGDDFVIRNGKAYNKNTSDGLYYEQLNSTNAGAVSLASADTGIAGSSL